VIGTVCLLVILSVCLSVCESTNEPISLKFSVVIGPTSRTFVGAPVPDHFSTCLTTAE